MRDKRPRTTLEAARDMPELLPPEQRSQYDITDLKEGGYFQIGDEVYRVDGIYRYEADGDEWFELKLLNLKTGEITFIEWEDDDDIEVSFQVEELDLNDLGLTKERLAQIDDDEEGSFTYEGTRYEYEESDKATFYRDPNGTGEQYYYWDFKGRDGTHTIGVERWGKEYESFLSRQVALSEIEILYPGDDDA